MNILITTPSYYPNKGGAESSLEDLAECFVRENHRTVVVTMRSSASLSRREVRHGVEIHRLDYPPQRARLRLLPSILVRSAALLVHLANIIRERDIEVVCLGLVGIESVIVLALRQFLTFRLVVYIRGGELRSYVRVSRLMRWSLGKCLRVCDGVIAVSQQLRKEVIAFEPASKDKIIVLPDAIDLGAIRAQPPYSYARPYGLFAGRLHPVKGIDILIRAFHSVAPQTPDLDLIIAGTGPLEESMKRLVLDSGLAGRVLFLGAQNRSTVFSLLKSCEFVLLPSHAEGCPLTILEALAAGKMPIGSRVKGIVELIQHGANGVLFEEADVEGLSRLILQYHRSASLRSELEDNIKRAGVDSYDVRNLYKKHLDAYRGFPTSA